MALLTTQQIVLAGLEATYASCAGGGDTFSNDGQTFLHVKNGSGGDITVTINSVEACNQGSDHDVAVVVTAGEERMIGPFPRKRFNSATGTASISYSGVSSLTIAALKF